MVDSDRAQNNGVRCRESAVFMQDNKDKNTCSISYLLLLTAVRIFGK
jgi:hypothetical protein